MSNSITDAKVDLPDFHPKWWALNTHVHTIVPSQFQTKKEVVCKRVEIETPDDDFLELDVLNLENENPVVVLFHGLEGSSERIYIRNLMHDLEQSGYSSVALNFRGCGSRLNRQRRFYHSGETSDYKRTFDWVTGHFPGKTVFAVGFSLGGNALVKSLGELGDAHPASKAVAVSPPYDLREGSVNLHKRFNRLYEYRFLRTLSRKATLKRAVYPDIPVFSGNSIYEFDDQVTAPVHGFDSAEHYYETCSSKHFYKHVKRPLLLIHSKEDTLCPIEFAPFEDIESNSFIETRFTKTGGHVGFLSSPGNWLNRTILAWLDNPNDSYLNPV